MFRCVHCLPAFIVPWISLMKEKIILKLHNQKNAANNDLVFQSYLNEKTFFFCSDLI